MASKRKAAKRKAAKLTRSDARLELALVGAALEAQAISLDAMNRELSTHKELMSQIHNKLQEHDQRIHAFEYTEDPGDSGGPRAPCKAHSVKDCELCGGAPPDEAA